MSSLGGVDFRDFGIIILRGSKVPILPETKDSTMTIPGMTGVYDYGATLGARMIELECAFVGFRSPADLQKAVRRFAAHLVDVYGRPRVMQLRLDWEPDNEYMVRYSGSLSVERLSALGTFTLPLLAADPYAYAVEKKEVNWIAPYGNGGITTIMNAGSVACALIITIEAPSEANIIYPAVGLGTTNYGAVGGAPYTSGVTLTIGGTSMTYIGTIAGHDKVVIDTENFTVTKNGQNDIQSWRGDFPMLSPGSVVVTESDITGVGAKITFSYKERWL